MRGPVYEISPVYGAVAAASVTASTAGTAITIVTTTNDHRLLVVTNNLNQDVLVTYNGADWIRLPASTPFALDLNSNQRCLRSGKIVGVYHAGVQPTTGSISVTLM